MGYRHLISERRGAVEYLTLNRPGVRNALNAEMIAELTDWTSRVQADQAVRVAVLAGAGTAFSAGADLAWMAQTIQYTEAENLSDATAMARMFAGLDALRMPLIGRVHGAALGGGAGLVAVCDAVVAEDGTVFGFTEVKLGLIPAVISPFVLAKIGRSAARALFLTGARISATRACEIGLVHEVVSPSALDGAIDRHVRDVLAAGPAAVAAAKSLIGEVWGRPHDQSGALAARAIAARRVSAEGQEGLRAFLEKRKPAWSADGEVPQRDPPGRE